MRTWGEIDKRLDPAYYKKFYMDLEKAVSAQTTYKLRDFIKFMASGVTPKITETVKYYVDADDGIPFLRVQNLTPEGLDYADCKYINQETHTTLLKRSQVVSGDLLIKITGVGRMAITCIAPHNFEGNINQHIVVVKTKRTDLNNQIAAFLNSDIGEMLASHRTTGGTRPALDYAALRSIPIILNQDIVKVMEKAYFAKQQKEKEAQQLLDSIDGYLLQELGIALPPKELDTLSNRMFFVNSENVLGGRLDPFYHKKIFMVNMSELFKGKYPHIYLKNIAKGLVKGILPTDIDKNGECRVVQISNINADGTIDLTGNITSKPIYSSQHKLNKGDILIVITGATIGKIGFWDYEGEYYLGGDIVKFNTGNYYLNIIYANLLKTLPYQLQLKRCVTGATNGHLALRDIENLPLPNITNLNTQKAIANRIVSSKTDAQFLKEQTKKIIENAKLEVEKMLIGGSL